MKKITFLLICVITCSTSLFSKDLFSKKDKNFLPEAGDWGISINAEPFLDYFGNFIGGNGTNSAPSIDFLSGNQLIYVKYFKNSQVAYRGGIRLGLDYDRFVTKTPKIPGNDPYITVDDTYSTSNDNIALTAGLEKRFGKTRLQGYYGVDGGLQYAHQVANWSYGNNLTIENPGMQTTKVDNGINLGLGTRAFLGLEYFILPKISLGGEFGWGVYVFYKAEGERVIKRLEGNTVITQQIPVGSTLQFGADNNAGNSIFGPAGSLRICFYL
jgi:hypothetical protein